MNSRLILAFLMVAAVAMFAMTDATPALAEEDTGVSVEIKGKDLSDAETDGDLTELPIAEDLPVKRKTEVHSEGNAFAGYRFLDSEGAGLFAAEYDKLVSGVTAGARFNYLSNDLKLALEGEFLNSADYHADLLFDYAGEYRFHLRTESLFHNLETLPLFNDPFNLGTAVYSPNDQASPSGLGISVEQNTAALRLKLHDFPIHLNLGYWSLLKEGHRQLIFADSAFEGTSTTVYSRIRPVNSRVQEGNAGFDSHLGPIDVIYNFQVREFEDNAGTPRDVNFVMRPDLAGATVRNSGLMEHNENPDSRYTSHTVKLHSSMSGGLVGAASYTFGKRENLSELYDVKGAEFAHTYLRNAAGDISYTPIKEISFAVKYRHQEVDSSSPASVVSIFSVPGIVKVRPSLSSDKDVVTASIVYRPINTVSLKGEYRGEFLHREQSLQVDVKDNWALHADEDSQRGTLTLTARPAKGLRIRSMYSYTATGNPSYGTSFATRHEGELLTTYNIANRWGASANLRSSRESNDRISARVIQTVDPQLTYQDFGHSLSRQRSLDNLTAGFWVALFARMTLSANVGFMRNSTDQVVLMTLLPSANEAASNYRAKSYLAGLNASYQLSEDIDLNLALQRIDSYSEFDPILVSYGVLGDTIGIKEISRLKTVESSLATRANYTFNKHISCSLEYTLRDFAERYSSAYDGTVHAVTAQLNAKW